MANKNEITIELEEYKELLLKDKPNDKDKMLLERIKELLYDHIEYEKNWNDIITVDFKNDTRFCDELITTIKVIDKEFYKEMIKFVCDEKQKKIMKKQIWKRLGQLKKSIRRIQKMNKVALIRKTYSRTNGKIYTEQHYGSFIYFSSK